MKKLKERIEYLGLNFKKEMTTAISVGAIFLVLSLALYLITKQLIFVLVLICVAILFEILFLTRYKGLEEKTKLDIQNEFISIFTFFKIYVKNGFNVYSALHEVSNFVSPRLKERFDTLLDNIDNDKSVEPFVKFARTFNALIIEQMMISVYQMVDEGVSSPYFSQFELIFSSLQSEMHMNDLYQKERSLNTQCSAPLIGSAILVVLITIGIVSVIGEMIGGL